MNGNLNGRSQFLSKKCVRGGVQEYHVSHISPKAKWVLKDEYSSKFPKSVTVVLGV